MILGRHFSQDGLQTQHGILINSYLKRLNKNARRPRDADGQEKEE